MGEEHLVVIGDAGRMRELPEKSVQLVVTSPSHMNFRLVGQEGNGYMRDFDEYLSNIMKIFRECKRVLKPKSFLCLNISDTASNMEKMPIPAHLLFALKRSGFSFCEDILWTTTRAQAPPPKGRQTGLFLSSVCTLPDFQVQRTLIFRKGRETTKTTPPKGFIPFRNSAVRYIENFEGASPMSQEIFHENLVSAILLHFSDEGDTVLDPFLGGGTLCRVAAKHGRIAVGYESNPYNLRIIRQNAGIPESRLKVVFQGEGRLI